MCFIVDIYWKSFIGTSDRFNSRICAGSRAYNCQKDTEISADTRCRNQMVIRNVHRIRYLTDTVSYGMSHTVQVATRGSNFWSSKVCEGGESREAYACRLTFGPPQFLFEIDDHVTQTHFWSVFAKTLRNTYQLLKFVLSLANSLWILSRSLELTMSSLSGTPIHHAFIIFLANSFWIDFSSKSYYEFTIFIAKSLWIHFLFLQINYDFTMNSLSFSWFQHERDFNMNAISATRIHYELIFNMDSIWIHFIFSRYL